MGFKAVFSSGTSTSRGIAVLFRNTFPFELLHSVSDANGNYVILDIKTQEQQFTLCALYGPNEDNPNFFENILQMVENMNNLSVVIVGDWNVVWTMRKITSTINTKITQKPKNIYMK